MADQSPSRGSDAAHLEGDTKLLWRCFEATGADTSDGPYGNWQQYVPTEVGYLRREQEKLGECVDVLLAAIEELSLWEPGRKGYAAAARRLRDERDWALRELSAEPDPLPPPTREELFTNG